MTAEPFDFEGILAGIDLELLTGAHRSRASLHVLGAGKGRGMWMLVEKYHDIYDAAHFDTAGLSAHGSGAWDNRRKRESA